MSVEILRLNELWLSSHKVRVEDLERLGDPLLAEKQATSVTRTAEGISLFLKAYPFRYLMHRLGLCLGISRAIRAYDNSSRLLEKGVLCPVPIALIRWPKSGMVLVTEALLEGAPLIEWFERLSRSRSSSPTLLPALDRKAFFRELAQFLLQIHQRGVYHSDLHDTNAWVRSGLDGRLTLYLLDVEAIRFCRKVSMRRRLKNLLRLCRNLGTAAAGAQLDGEALAAEFADCYFSAAGILPTSHLAEKVKAAAGRGRERWEEVNCLD